MCEKVEKTRNTVFFPMSCGARSSGGCGAIWLDERSKFARGCGAKRVSKPKCHKHLMLRALLEMHILKSKGVKHLSCGPLLEVELSKKCMALWFEAHFDVKTCKVGS